MRIYALVEGKTESRFLTTVLAAHLAQAGHSIHPIQVQTSRTQRGGLVSFEKVERELRNLFKQHSAADVRFTTMFDLYRLPADFPAHATGDPDRIEAAIAAHIGEPRLIPYIQRHEFETLLYVDLSVLPAYFIGYESESQIAVTRLAKSVANEDPEDIDGGVNTAPSRRLIDHLPRYENRKSDVGPDAAAQIGLTALRQRCPRFHRWVSILESIAPLDR